MTPPRPVRIGIVGATGQVGAVMRRILLERGFPVSEIRFFASARSAGTTIAWGDREVVVEDAETADPSGLDIALFSAGGATSRLLAPRFAAAGAVVVDNSSAWRMDPDVPLVVSEVNPAAVRLARKGIIANPNCTTMAAMPVLKPLHDEAGLVRLVVSTYQAVSGSGLAGVEELAGQVAAVGDRGPLLTHDGAAFEMPGAGEVRPPDRVQRAPDGRLGRRRRQRRDRRGAEAPQREPQDPRHPGPAGLRHLRAGAGLHRSLALGERGVRVGPAGQAGGRDPRRPRPVCCCPTYPTPLQAAGQDPSFVGRIRQDSGVDGERGLALFVTGDNLRKGAALNTVQIAELVAADRG